MKVLVGSLKNKYCSDNAISISDTALFSCDENSLLEINLLNKAEKTVYGAIVKVISFNAQGETVKQNIIRQDNIGLSAGQTMAVSVVLPKDTEYGVIYVQTIVFDDLAADLTPRTAHFATYEHVSSVVTAFLQTSV